MAFSIAWVKERVREGKPSLLSWKSNGKELTNKEITKLVAECERKGYSFIPPCDNVNARGHCVGHPALG